VPAANFSDFAPRVRKSFSRIPRIIDIPNLLEIQKLSFERFLQTGIEMEKRDNVGLQAVFNSVFPIRDFNDTASLEFVGYALEQPKYDVQECLQRGMTYAAPFKVTIRLVAWDEADGSQTIRDVKEQEVYFGEIPIMTDNGTFIINGTERVIVSQLHRSPGIFYDTSISTTVSAAGKKLFSCRVIPYRGSWLDIEYDHKDIVHARIDRRRKIQVTVLLKALGYQPEELLQHYLPHLRKVNPDFDASWIETSYHHRVDGAQPVIVEQGHLLGHRLFGTCMSTGQEGQPCEQHESHREVSQGRWRSGRGSG